MVQMAISFEGMSHTYEKALEYANLFFTVVFALEAALKLTGLGLHYFASGWNRFDFVVVVSSLIDILMKQLQNSDLKFLRVGP